jgi:hypothetical protein
MLSELARDLEAHRKSPGRCAEVVSALSSIDEILRDTANWPDEANELKTTLHIVEEAPGGITHVESRRVVDLVGDIKRTLNPDRDWQPPRPDPTAALDKIREAAGIFRAAAARMKARIE